MKKKLLSICTLLVLSGDLFADDTFCVDNVTLPLNGEANVTVRFNLDEGSTCSGYTFWLQVPEELAFVTYVKNEKTYITYTVGDCYDETPTITPNINEGYLKVGCLTANSDPLNKQEGMLVAFKLKGIASVSIGDTFTGTLTMGTISAEDGTVHNVADAIFTIIIDEPIDTRTVLDETSTVVPESGTNVDVLVKRTINANQWSTICLPFAMTEAQVKEAFGEDVRLGDFTGYDISEDNDENIVGITVNFNEVTAIEANHPYIIKVSEAVAEFTVDDVDIEPEDEPCVSFGYETGRRPVVYHPADFIGTYVADFDFYHDAQKQALFLSGNKFYYATDNTQHMKAFRAYFDFDDVLDDLYDGSANVKMTVLNDDETVVENLNVGQSILDAIYDLSGRKVTRPRQRGIYITDGKKILF